jgi:hypothetical protein
MVVDRFSDPHRPDYTSRAAFLEEHRQAESRRDYKRRQLEEQEQQEREALMKRDYATELAKIIDLTGERDEQTKALAVDYLAKNIAARSAQPDRILAKDLLALGEKSLKEAHKLEELQRQQQGRDLDEHQELPRAQQFQDQARRENPTHYYAALNETRRQVDNAVSAEKEAGLNDGADRGNVEGRYAPLDETHREVAEASKPLDRSERETRDAEAHLTSGEMGDARQSRASVLRTLLENLARDNQMENELEQGGLSDLGRSG